LAQVHPFFDVEKIRKKEKRNQKRAAKKQGRKKKDTHKKKNPSKQNHTTSKGQCLVYIKIKKRCMGTVFLRATW
jgi:hypothetical protein